MEKRNLILLYDKLINIYEVYFVLWKMKKDGSIEKVGEFYNYCEFVYMLVDYIKEMNYIYIEFLLVLEYLFDMFWGY